jgi:hypothetical protein
MATKDASENMSMKLSWACLKKNLDVTYTAVIHQAKRNTAHAGYDAMKIANGFVRANSMPALPRARAPSLGPTDELKVGKRVKSASSIQAHTSPFRSPIIGADAAFPRANQPAHNAGRSVTTAGAR